MSTSRTKRSAAPATGAASGSARLLAGGNPQIPKGLGEAPVQAYIAAMPGWKRALGERIDRIIGEVVPGVRKAVRYNSPLYGAGGDGWFLGVHCLTHYVKVAFFRGAALDPLPPGTSTQAEVRYLDVHETDVFDDARFADWVRQASALPGVPV